MISEYSSNLCSADVKQTEAARELICGVSLLDKGGLVQKGPQKLTLKTWQAHSLYCLPRPALVLGDTHYAERSVLL